MDTSTEKKDDLLSSIQESELSSRSFLDYDSLTDEELVCRYILEKKNKGQFLSYEHYSMIKNWILRCHSLDDLLMILDEIFSDMKNKSRFSMETLNKKVLKKIQTLSRNI